MNLITGESKELLQLPVGDRLISNVSENFAGLEADGRAVYFLKKSNGKAFLVAYDVTQRQGREVQLPAAEMVGPFKISGRIAVYSKDRLYLLEDGELRPVLDFPASFAAWVSPAEVRDFQPPFGRAPFLIRRDSLYLPGVRGHEHGLLFISLQGQTPNFAFISSQGEATYTQDEKGRPIIARAGEITAYEDTAAVPLRSDTQLTAKGQAYSNGHFVVGFARTGGGMDALRFYVDDQIADYSLAKLRGLIDVGLFTLAGTMMFVYLIEQNQSSMGITVWDI